MMIGCCAVGRDHVGLCGTYVGLCGINRDWGGIKGVVQVAIIKVSASLVKSAITHHYSDSIKSPLAHLESHFYF